MIMIRKIEKTGLALVSAILFMFVMVLPVSAQVASGTPVASDTIVSASTKEDSKGQTTDVTSAGYSQNQETSTLEEKISQFNQQFCPPEKTIDEINDFNLTRLARAELIKRADLDKYREMVLVDGKVYFKKDSQDPDPQDKPKPEKPIGKAGKNLIGSFDIACEELKNKKNRGETKGTQKPAQILKLKKRRVVYRDQENQLKEMDLYSPPKFPAKKRKIAGKKGKLIKDFATTIMVPKDGTANASNTTEFEDMPSADSWIDE